MIKESFLLFSRNKLILDKQVRSILFELFQLFLSLTIPLVLVFVSIVLLFCINSSSSKVKFAPKWVSLRPKLCEHLMKLAHTNVKFYPEVSFNFIPVWVHFGSHVTCSSSLRVSCKRARGRLHENRSELKPVWDFTLGKNFT